MELERVLNQVRNGIRAVMQQQEAKRAEQQARPGSENAAG
jgi:hypothetical protein